MPPKQKRDPSNPILNSPYEDPGWHYATDQTGNLNLTEPVLREFVRAQSGSMASVWDNKDDEVWNDV